MSDWSSGGSPVAEGITAGGARYPAGPPSDWPAHAPTAPAGTDASGWSGPPPPSPPGDGRGRLAAVITVVGVVVVLALAVLAIGSFADGEGDEEADAPTTVDLSDPEITAPPSEEPLVPTMPSLPDLLPGEGAEAGAVPLEDVLPDLIAFVEETRGHQFVTEPVVEAVPAAEFERLLADEDDELTEEVQRQGVADAALGLIPPAADLAEINRQARSIGVFGFYDPTTGEMYVKGDAVTPYVQAVIVHELTHALDDQVFDLSRIDELSARPDEAALGFLGLVEGSAEYVRTAFVDQLSPDEQADYAQNEIQLGLDQIPLLTIPPAVLLESQFPYASGLELVLALVDEGGIAALDAAYDDPPTTSEQVFDPTVYEAGEPAVELRPLEADAEAVAEGAFGALDVALLDIAGAMMDPTLLLAPLAPVDGFGGGRYVSWTEGDVSCIRFEVVGDDAAATAELADRVESWAGTVGEAEVGTRTGSGGVEVVTAERCA